jgi:hypothetical protein
MTNTLSIELRRHPSERFILYLLTRVHPSACSNSEVQEVLVNYRLPTATDQYLDALRQMLIADLPSPFLPRDPRAMKTVSFLKKHRVHSLHHPSEEAKQANSILVDLTVRRVVEMGLLGRVPYSTIATQVCRRHNVSIDENGVRAYSHYYWDVAAYSLEEWAALLSSQQHLPMSVRDTHLAALEAGRHVALHRMGMRQAIDQQTMLRDAMRRVYINLVEIDERMPMSQGKVSSMCLLSGTLTALDRRITTGDDELRRLLRTFERLRLQQDGDRDRPKSIDALVRASDGGSYTDNSGVINARDLDEEEVDDAQLE